VHSAVGRCAAAVGRALLLLVDALLLLTTMLMLPLLLWCCGCSAVVAAEPATKIRTNRRQSQTKADRQQTTADTRPRFADRQQTDRRQTAHKKLKTF
jgi:hypothetical protein